MRASRAHAYLPEAAELLIAPTRAIAAMIGGKRAAFGKRTLVRISNILYVQNAGRTIIKMIQEEYKKT
jgi:hypothetical protein